MVRPAAGTVLGPGVQETGRFRAGVVKETGRFQAGVVKETGRFLAGVVKETRRFPDASVALAPFINCSEADF